MKYLLLLSLFTVLSCTQKTPIEVDSPNPIIEEEPEQTEVDDLAKSIDTLGVCRTFINQ